MASGFDDLIDRLLYDVALSGSQGIAAEQFENAVKTFYAQQVTAEATPEKPIDIFSDAPPAVNVNVDDAFLRSTLKWLCKHPDVEVKDIQISDQELGTIQPKEGAEADLEQVPHSSYSSTFQEELKGKRICATEDRVWHAIAGHGVDHQRVPAKEFECLSVIAAHGPGGILQPDVCRLTGQDKRSVPKRTDALAQKGYITKDNVIGSRSRTSLLKLTKYTAMQISTASDDPQPAMPDPESGPVIFYNVWFDTMIRLLKENGNIISMNDLRVGLDIHQKRWEMKALLRCIRRIDDGGCIRRLTARMQDPQGNAIKRISTGLDRKVKAIQLLREPTDYDRLRWAQNVPKARSRPVDGTEDVKNPAVNEEDAAESDDDDDDQILDPDQELNDLDLIKQRTPPQWNPLIPYPNFMFKLVHNAGPFGISSMDLAARATGSLWRRPLDEVMGKLTDIWRHSQPSHLRHLALIRDTAIHAKAAHYQYRTLAHFQTAVERGDVLWDAIGGDPNAASEGEAKPQWAEPDLDEWGFPRLDPEDFAGGDGRASLAYAGSQLQKKRAPIYQDDFDTASDVDNLMVYPFADRRTKHGPKLGSRRKMNENTAIAKKRRKMNEKEHKEFDHWAQAAAERRVLAEMQANSGPAESVSATSQSYADPIESQITIADLPVDRVQQVKADILARQKPGIYINPPGARTLKKDVCVIRGRPPNALIAVIKTDQLHQLPWFRNEEDFGMPSSAPYLTESTAGEAPALSQTSARIQSNLYLEMTTSRKRHLDFEDTDAPASKRIRLESGDIEAKSPKKRPAEPEDAEHMPTKRPRLASDATDHGATEKSQPIPVEVLQSANIAEGTSATPVIHNADLAISEEVVPTSDGVESRTVTRLPDHLSGPATSENTPSTSTPQTLQADQSTAKFPQVQELKDRLWQLRHRRGRRSPATLAEIRQLEERIATLEPQEMQTEVDQPSHVKQSFPTQPFPPRVQKVQRKPTHIRGAVRLLEATERSLGSRPRLIVKLQMRERQPAEKLLPENAQEPESDTVKSGQPQTETSAPTMPVTLPVNGEPAAHNSSASRSVVELSPQDTTPSTGGAQFANDASELRKKPGNDADDCTLASIPSASMEGHDSVSSAHPTHQPIETNASHDNLSVPKTHSNDQPAINEVNEMQPLVIGDPIEVDKPGSSHVSEFQNLIASKSSEKENSPSKRPKKRGILRAGGSVAAQRHNAIFDALRQCSGVFPGNHVIWYAVVTYWQKKFNATPDKHTIERAVTNLIANGSLKKFTFQFKTKRGLVQTRSILAMPEIGPSSPVFQAMQQNIKDAWPCQYLPTEVEISDHMRQQANKLFGQRRPQDGDKETTSSNRPESRSKVYDKYPEDEGAAVRQTEYSADYAEMEARAQGFPNAESLRLHRLQQNHAYRRTWEWQDASALGSSFSDANMSSFNEAQAAVRGPLSTNLHPFGTSSYRLIDRFNNVRLSHAQSPDARSRLAMASYRRPLSTLRSNVLGHKGIQKPSQRTATVNPYLPSQRAHSELNPTWLMSMQPSNPLGKKARRKWWDTDTEITVTTDAKLRKRSALALMNPVQTFNPITGTFGTLFSGSVTRPGSSAQMPSKSRAIISEATWTLNPTPESLEEILNRITRLGHSRAKTTDSKVDQFFHDVNLVQTWEHEIIRSDRNLPPKSTSWPFINHVLNQPLTVGIPDPFIPSLRAQAQVPAIQSKPRSDGIPHVQTIKVRRQYKPRAKTGISAADVPGPSNESLSTSFTTSGPEPAIRQTAPRDRAAAAAFKDADRLVTAYALVAAICGGINQDRPNWLLIAHALGFRYNGEFLRRRWAHHRRFRQKDADKLRDAIREPFLKAYETGWLPPINFQALEKTDWPLLLAWVESEVVPSGEKKAPVVPDLPESKAMLEKTYDIIERRDPYEPSRDDYFTGTTDQGRKHLIFRYCYGTLLSGQSKPGQVSNEPNVMVKSWIRAVAMTKQWYYNADLAARKLGVFPNHVLKSASKELMDGRIFTQSKKDRQLPGRNFQIHHDVLMQFKRWPGKHEEFKFLRVVAQARGAITDYFETSDQLDLIPTATDPQYLVLTNMVSQGLLAISAVLPERNDEFDAPFPRLTQWSYSGYNYETKKVDGSTLKFPIVYRKTAAYTASHGLHTGVPIPLQAPIVPGEPDRRIPFWVDIHGNLIDDVWDMAVRSLLHLLVYRPGSHARSMATAHHGKFGAWEIDLVLAWLDHVGAATRCGAGEEDVNGIWTGGWRAAEFWYCLFLPEVATWKAPAGMDFSVNSG